MSKSRAVPPLLSRMVALGAAAAMLLLPSALTGPASAAPDAPAASGTAAEPGYYLVTAAGQQPGVLAHALELTGFDVLEGSLDRGVPVLADAAAVARLRQRGLKVQYTGPLYQPVARSFRADSNTYYGGYHTAAGHEAHNRQVSTEHPELAKLYTIGRSWLKTQGRGGHDIQALCITKIQQGDCELTNTGRKPKFTLMSQMHARELATGELSYLWIDHLINNYGTNSEVTALMDSTELWVIPIANPDGVDIVASNSTRPVAQRKNAHDNGCTGTGRGVDLNRNSSYHWDVNQGTKCAETYPGTGPASEPETQGIQNFLATIYRDTKPAADFSAASKSTTGAFLTVHSYSQLNIYPYGWTNQLAPNNNDLKTIADAMKRANKYDVVHGDGGLNYFAPGATDDWIYGQLGVPGYTIEVGPGSGSCGGFFPTYSCVNGFWKLNLPAYLAVAKAAAAPYPTGR